MSEQDTPEGEGLVPVPDEEFPTPNEWPSPVQLVATFLNFLDSDDRSNHILRQLVTPESVDTWRRGLDTVAKMLEGYALATGVQNAHDGNHDVCTMLSTCASSVTPATATRSPPTSLSRRWSPRSSIDLNSASRSAVGAYTASGTTSCLSTCVAPEPRRLRQHIVNLEPA